MATEDNLAWEARQRPRAAAAAIVAALFSLGASIASGLLFSDAPQSGFLEALDRAAQPGPAEGLESQRLAFYEFYDSRSAGLLITSLVQAVAFVAMGYLLAFLASATRARRPEMPKVGLYLGLGGGVLLAISTLLLTAASQIAVNDFLSGPRTVTEADEIGRGSGLVTAQILRLPGTLALALGFVLISLHAMRAGLLTRFMGVLGIIVGVLVVIPIGSGLPVVQCFWLFAVGLILLGRWPRGVPPAWSTGRAEPWPSPQSAREAPPEEPEPVRVGGEERGDGPRRKRKRRG